MVWRAAGDDLCGRARRRTSGPLFLDWLEDRTAPALITVTTLSDASAGDGLVSLREAIQAANTDTSVDGSTAGSGADTIVFDPSLTAFGPATINLTLFDAGLNNTEVGPTAFRITSDVTIQGPSGANGIVIAGHRGSQFPPV